MRSAWLLPEHIADVLPAQARQLETLRRRLFDQAQGYGYELVIPPLLEHLDALLSGTGHELDLSTFKLVDQLSGRMLGLRADTTAQAARIDAHLLNRPGVTRLCYCGPVLHTRATGMAATREPLQFGAELFGFAGLQADLEVAELALDCLGAAGLGPLVIDLADARVLRGVLAGVPLDAEGLQALARALASKDAPALAELAAPLPGSTREALLALLRLYGGEDVLGAARQALPDRPLIRKALDDLAWLGTHLQAAHPQLKITYDLSDMSGYAYYSGPRFGLYAPGCSDTLARGGRYDEVGAVFGRSRPAVGFSLDLKSLAEALRAGAMAALPAVQAPWSEDPALRAEVRRLRAQGVVVVCSLPSGSEAETASDTAQAAAWLPDRELVCRQGRWVVEPLAAATGATAPTDAPAPAPQRII
jgi:ATP phosphoribosyltransferase regulatory subunit